MKTVMTLIIAVTFYSVSPLFAQTGSVSGTAVTGRGVSVIAADTLSRVDSASGARMRVLDFPGGIEAILRDIPSNLRHITGELLLAQGEIENYASVIGLPAAENCIITRYHSVEDSTVSWQAKMFSSDEYEKAAAQYKL